MQQCELLLTLSGVYALVNRGSSALCGLRRVLMSDPMYASYGAGRGEGDEICRDNAGAGGRFKKI